MSDKYDPKKNLEELEIAKKIVRCPRVEEARLNLFLTVGQFCSLLDISEGDYVRMKGGEKELSVNQKLFIVEALRIAREKGLIPEGPGGPEHEYWKHRIAEFLMGKGYQVEIEKPIGKGKTVDILATKNSERIAIEIETGKSDIVKNILKSLNEEFSKIILVPLSPKIRSEIYMRLKEFPGWDSHKVEILNLKDLFKGEIANFI